MVTLPVELTFDTNFWIRAFMDDYSLAAVLCSRSPSNSSGVASSIPVPSHTFVDIDHEIISTVILLPSADLFKKGFCQLQAKVCARITG